jgi:hypothetical protein
MAMARIGSNFPYVPVTKLSQLAIDYDKNWLQFGITNLKELAASMNKGDLLTHGGHIVKITPGLIGTVLTAKGIGNSIAWEMMHLATTGYKDTATRFQLVL